MRYPHKYIITEIKQGGFSATLSGINSRI